MNYFIVFVDANEFEWCVLLTRDYEYATRVFEDLCALPGWNIELRQTEEDIDTYKSYELLKHREAI